MQRSHLLTRLPTLRPAFVPAFRPFSTSSCSRSSGPPSHAPSTSTASEGAAPTPAQGQESIESPYFVPRSQFGELPVYSDIRNGGTRCLTIVRKVHGDISALHRDLASFLDSSTVSFAKPQSQQIVIKGDWVREVKEWLAVRGF
ncbi:hypothetical protein JCM10212_002662 [Sporobolomyces blumeae]